MEIKETNLQAAYNVADENGKQMLQALFPEMKWIQNTDKSKLPVTERIKTFEDACRELGEDNPMVVAYQCNVEVDECDNDILAYLKLRIICAALNEGWEPKFTKGESRYYPWFYLYTQQVLDNMDDEEKQERHMIGTGDYETEYCGFGSAYSAYASSDTYAYIGSRLCLKNNELATYCGKQFIDLWADFNLIRKK